MRRTHTRKYLFIWSKGVYKNFLKKLNLHFVAVSVLQAVTNLKRQTVGNQAYEVIIGGQKRKIVASSLQVIYEGSH